MGDARNGVEPFAALAENVAAQLGVAVHIVVAQGEKAEKATGFEAAMCLECQMKVATFVAVVVTTVGECVVVPAALTDRTARQDRDEFVLRCLLVKRYDSEQC